MKKLRLNKALTVLSFLAAVLLVPGSQSVLAEPTGSTADGLSWSVVVGDCSERLRKAWRETYHHEPQEGQALRLVIEVTVESSMTGVDKVVTSQELLSDGTRKYLFNEHFTVLEDDKVTVQFTNVAREVIIRRPRSRERALASYRENMISTLDTMLSLGKISSCIENNSGTVVKLELGEEGRTMFRVDEMTLVMKEMHGLTLVKRMEVKYSSNHPTLTRTVMDLSAFDPSASRDSRIKRSPLEHLFDGQGKLLTRYEGWTVIDERNTSSQ